MIDEHIVKSASIIKSKQGMIKISCPRNDKKKSMTDCNTVR